MIQADNGRGTTSVSGGQGEIWETCVFSSNFCYEPKTDLKKKEVIKKISERSHEMLIVVVFGEI